MMSDFISEKTTIVLEQYQQLKILGRSPGQAIEKSLVYVKEWREADLLAQEVIVYQEVNVILPRR